jgi:aspartyl-tRNA(Asn)/glutamyl-tRNA(Gln) amidotransferase subunit A
MTADTLAQVIDDINAREQASPAEIAAAAVQRARKWQPAVDSYIEIADDSEVAAAAAAVSAGSALSGIPIAVKDNIDVAGMRCTAGSGFFASRVAAADAGCIRKLRDAGAVVIGKTNMHEFAYGATNDNPFFGRCRNPWNPDRIPGGSSGGSAVAIATDTCVAALGSDTGGSGRIPAAFCGVTGFRPSHGTVSSTGVFPVARSFDTVSIMARQVGDVAAVFGVIAGYDPDDPRSVREPTDRPSGSAGATGAGLKIGLLDTADVADTENEISAAIAGAADVFDSAGHRVTKITVPGLAEAFDACDTIMKCEALAVHRERLENDPEGFGEDTRRRLELGRRITASSLAEAYDYQAIWARRIEKLFSELDFLILPTAPVSPPLAQGAETVSTTAQVARLTYPWSLAKVPALSVPCGHTSAGLPIGMQIAGARFRDADLLTLGRQYQQMTEWHLLRPPEAAHESANLRTGPRRPPQRGGNGYA